MSIRWPWVVALLAVALVGAAAAAMLLGVAATSPEVVWNIRAPRIVMAVIVGAGLAVAGALMQGSLGNPLADPALVGVSGGAALGTAAAVVGCPPGIRGPRSSRSSSPAWPSPRSRQRHSQSSSR